MTNPRPIPDRMSVTEPSFDSEFGRGLVITLDGAEQRWVVGYCISEGWVERFKLAPDGNPRAIGGEVEKEKVTGTVVVTRRP